MHEIFLGSSSERDKQFLLVEHAGARNLAYKIPLLHCQCQDYWFLYFFYLRAGYFLTVWGKICYRDEYCQYLPITVLQVIFSIAAIVSTVKGAFGSSATLKQLVRTFLLENFPRLPALKIRLLRLTFKTFAFYFTMNCLYTNGGSPKIRGCQVSLCTKTLIQFSQLCHDEITSDNYELIKIQICDNTNRWCPSSCKRSLLQQSWQLLHFHWSRRQGIKGLVVGRSQFTFQTGLGQLYHWDATTPLLLPVLSKKRVLVILGRGIHQKGGIWFCLDFMRNFILCF